MSNQFFPSRFMVFGTGFSLGLVLIFGVSTIANAQKFNPPKRGAPTTTAGGASRSACVKGELPLTLLVPSSQLGLTVSPRPEFFVFVPQTAAKSATFLIKDSNDRDFYRTTVPLAAKPGVISLRLPDSAPALEVGKDYQWYFSITCTQDSLEDVFTSAWIQRIAPDQTLSTTLKGTSLRSHPAFYAKAGIWHDTLTALAQLRRQNSGDLTVIANWNELLKSAGLEKIVGVPTIQEQSGNQTRKN